MRLYFLDFLIVRNIKVVTPELKSRKIPARRIFRDKEILDTLLFRILSDSASVINCLPRDNEKDKPHVFSSAASGKVEDIL